MCRVARNWLSKDRILLLKCFTKDQTGMHAVQSYLISFSCFVENSSKTTARVVAVCEICMSTAASRYGHGNVDVGRLDVVRLALCSCVTTATECERTEWMRTYSMPFAVLMSKATADSPE